MADDKSSDSGPGLIFFILLIISALFVLSGGNNQEGGTKQGLLRQIIPAGSTSTSESRSSRTSGTAKQAVSIDGLTNGDGDRPREEYLRLRASSNNKQPVNITNWELRSLIHFNLKIPSGVRTLYTGVVNPLQPITLAPGEVAFVNSGRSPLGTSFRANICSGYLNQYQRFYPPFDEYVCPDNRDEEHLMVAAGLDDDCIDYLESLPRCRYPEERIPSRLSRKCKDYAYQNLNYNACVAKYVNRPDFYTGEWRVFLGQSRDLWKPNRESIFLLDANANLVDTYRY